jgi:hypothetical protein
LDNTGLAGPSELDVLTKGGPAGEDQKDITREAQPASNAYKLSAGCCSLATRGVREDISVFKAIEDKALELFMRVQAKLAELKQEERGVISAEFIAVTAVAVLIAITILYTVFSEQLENAITTIGEELNSWVSDEFDDVT